MDPHHQCRWPRSRTPHVNQTLELVALSKLHRVACHVSRNLLNDPTPQPHSAPSNTTNKAETVVLRLSKDQSFFHHSSAAASLVTRHPKSRPPSTVCMTYMRQPSSPTNTPTSFAPNEPIGQPADATWPPLTTPSLTPNNNRRNSNDDGDDNDDDDDNNDGDTLANEFDDVNVAPSRRVCAGVSCESVASRLTVVLSNLEHTCCVAYPSSSPRRPSSFWRRRPRRPRPGVVVRLCGCVVEWLCGGVVESLFEHVIIDAASEASPPICASRPMLVCVHYTR